MALTNLAGWKPTAIFMPPTRSAGQRSVLSVSSLTRLLMKALPPMATMKKSAIMYRPAMEGFLQVDRSNLIGSKKVAYNRR